jgi:membrane fusion protein, multidrug efflux system
MGDEQKALNSPHGETAVEPKQSDAAGGRNPPQEPPPEEPPRRSRKRKWFWIAALLLLVLVAVLVAFRYRSEEEKKKKAAAAAKPQGASITVGESKTGDINIYVNALGTVTPIYTVTVYSQITGTVQEVHYTEGQVVQKGDPLVDVDPQPYLATVTQAEGNLEHDQGVLDQARMDLTRYQAAYARNAIAKQQLDDQEQAVKQYEGTVKSDQGTLAYDKVQLAYCHIVAPISGKVGLRLVDPGNVIFSGSSSTLVVITQLQPITVVFNVSEDDLTEVQSQMKGKPALEVDAYDRANDKQLEVGKLASLDNQIDTTTGTVKFRANFANQGLALFPNQFVNVRLLTHTLTNATLVPTAAVQRNGTAAFVYIVKPDPKNAGGEVVAVQGVTTLTSNDQVTAVQGINPGVTVATSGFNRLESGAQVRTSVPGQKGPGQKGGQKSTPSTNSQAPGGTGAGSTGSGNTTP